MSPYRQLRLNRNLSIDAAMALLLIIVPSFPTLLHAVFWYCVPLIALWLCHFAQRDPVRLID